MRKFLPLALLICGCVSRAELITVRETLWQGSQAAFKERNMLVQKVAATQPLPAYNTNDLKLRTDAEQELENFVNKSRAGDKSIFERPQ